MKPVRACLAPVLNRDEPARPLPPYGRTLLTRLAPPSTWRRLWGSSADGMRLTLTVACGPDAWGFARRWHEQRLVVVAPLREDPERFDWRALAGHDPVLLQPCGTVDRAHVEAVAVALLRDGVERVLVLLERGAVRYWREGAT